MVTNADSVDVVLVVCPRCQGSGNGAVLGRVVRNHRGEHRFVIAAPEGDAGDGRFGDDQLLRPAEFVTFDFEDRRAGRSSSLDVECRHGRRSVARTRLEHEIASHRDGKPARILFSEPPSH